MNQGLFHALIVLTTCFASSSISRAEERPPNIVFLLIDDLGWNDVGCFGSTFHETPNIDRLAKEGMKFTNGYAACPVCSPTRASVMTGKYPARLKLTNFLKGRRSPKGSPVLTAEYADQLELEEVTIAEALKTAGYATCFVGKWHLGTERFFPEHQGFDVNIGGTRSGMPRSFFWPRWKKNPPLAGNFEGEYLPDRLSKEACRFIERHHDRPFFLFLSHYSVHIPIEAKGDLVAKYERKLAKLRESGETRGVRGGVQSNPHYAAMVESIDESVGRVLETLSRQGVADRTVVVFFSDNGGLVTPEGRRTPATTLAPLRRGKGFLYEGGVREPLIVRWPGVTRPGAVCGVPVISNDFFPTICEMAGVTKPPKRGAIDGRSLVALLRDPGTRQQGRDLFWHYPHFSNQGGRPGGAVRSGKWKLIERYESGKLELYDLEADLGESRNLADARPELAKSLQQRLARWRDSVDANMPRPNPAYQQR